MELEIKDLIYIVGFGLQLFFWVIIKFNDLKHLKNDMKEIKDVVLLDHDNLIKIKTRCQDKHGEL